MNQVTIDHKNLNNGKAMTFSTPLSKEEFLLQFQEIFADECYKEATKRGKNLTIVDIGGNMGLSTIYLSPYAKNYYVLEPSSAHYPALVENTKHLPQVKTFKLALSADNGLDVIKDNDSDGRVESFFGKGNASERVTTITLDKFMTDQKIDHIDVLKFDAEGAEYLVFPSVGFARVADKVDFIIGETHYLDNFMPQHLEMMFDNYNFKFNFLPLDNMYREINFQGDPKWLDKTYKLWLQTNFMAERIHD